MMSAIVNGINAVLDFFKMITNLIVTIFKSFFQFMDLMISGTANFTNIVSLLPGFIGAGVLVVISIMTIKTIISLGGASS